jgi:hypothetical protein
MCFRPISYVFRDLSLDNDFYNLTMTYRLDSDINWIYGATFDIETGLAVAPDVNVQWRTPDDNFKGSLLSYDQQKLN